MAWRGYSLLCPAATTRPGCVSPTSFLLLTVFCTLTKETFWFVKFPLLRVLCRNLKNIWLFQCYSINWYLLIHPYPSIPDHSRSHHQHNQFLTFHVLKTKNPKVTTISITNYKPKLGMSSNSSSFTLLYLSRSLAAWANRSWQFVGSLFLVKLDSRFVLSPLLDI